MRNHRALGAVSTTAGLSIADASPEHPGAQSTPTTLAPSAAGRPRHGTIVARLAVLLGLMTTLLGTLVVPASAAPGDLLSPITIVNSATSGHLLPWGFGDDHDDNIWVVASNSATRGDQWTFEGSGSGYYLIRNNATGKCLKPAPFTYFGKTYVTQASCNDSFEFQWTLEHSPFTNLYKIVNRSTRLAMTPYQNLPDQVVVLDTNSNDAKNWWSLTSI
ncbi:RICIN domain-containing protein [Kitasatospora sp. NPDC056531]|uniref:RICIN domain-containing protein n=1 Tax=Kitasatospora sp. NPDC056531 TaxID=3345856 RepID=UPI003690A4AD